MTDTPTSESVEPAAAPARKRGNALGGKVLAELKEIAAELKIEGASSMRKGQLIDAIKAARGDAPRTAPKQSEPQQEALPAGDDSPAEASKAQPKKKSGATGAAKDDRNEPQRARQADQRRSEQGGAQAKEQDGKQRGDGKADDQRGAKGRSNDEQRSKVDRSDDRQKNDRHDDQRGKGDWSDDRQKNDRNDKNDDRQDNGGRGGANDQRNGESRNGNDDTGEGSGRRRNRRGRNRGNRGPDGEPTYTEEDVLVPAAGILDILDNYAFVRTTGYLPSENDVYLSLSMVRKLGLRKGDAVTGQVRQPREGERKEKFNPMVRIDTVNGVTPEEARGRVDFSDLTPLFPAERLSLETDAAHLTTRVVDLFAPIGKGQRGLIVSPPKAGKTMVMQAIANAITANNPECHLMVVLVDERPEEVTEMQRSVKGEVIASTFDRPASDHTTVAELAIERAKRLVELGHDVVVLLDSITRLGRAYNQSAPSSGRVMSGGVDASALYPPKKFFGAARNIEDGGSLTILATALVETGSRMDEVIFEEFKGTGNSELRLRRDFADRRLFPAIDLEASSTRREELLLGKEELAVTWKLRRLLSGLDSQQGLELVLERLRKTATNAEFLQNANQTISASGSAAE